MSVYQAKNQNSDICHLTRAQTEFGHALAPQTLFGRLAETEFLGQYVPKLEFGNEAGLT
jgi:hypothetical protein